MEGNSNSISFGAKNIGIPYLTKIQVITFLSTFRILTFCFQCMSGTSPPLGERRNRKKEKERKKKKRKIFHIRYLYFLKHLPTLRTKKSELLYITDLNNSPFSIKFNILKNKTYLNWRTTAGMTSFHLLLSSMLKLANNKSSLKKDQKYMPLAFVRAESMYHLLSSYPGRFPKL